MSVEWFAMCVGFVTGALSVVGAIYIADRENSKNNLEAISKKSLEAAKRRKRQILSKTRLSYHSPNKKAPTDCNQ